MNQSVPCLLSAAWTGKGLKNKQFVAPHQRCDGAIDRSTIIDSGMHIYGHTRLSRAFLRTTLRDKVPRGITVGTPIFLLFIVFYVRKI